MISLSDLSMPKLSVFARSFFVFLVACVAFTGCGGSGPKLTSVKGKVTIGGTDLKAGVVTFIPDTLKGNKNAKGPAIGKINSDGTYTLTTEGKDGAPLGWYKVTVVTKMPGMDAGQPDVGKPDMGGDVNASYASSETTPLHVEVVATPQPGQYDLKVNR
jgi:hypothetical protein